MTTDPLAWETLDSSVSYSCPGFDVRTETVRLPDGTTTDFDYLSEPQSVAILPFTSDGTVVTIEEWRQAVERINHGLPVGTVEPGDENLEMAARRELLEETGHEATTLDPLVTVEPANGLADSVMHFFVARDCRPSAEQRLDHDESIRVTITDFDSLCTSLIAGEIRDGRTVLALSYYLLTAGETDGLLARGSTDR